MLRMHLKFEERMLNGAVLSSLKGLDYSLGRFPSAKALGYFQGSSGAEAVGIVALNDSSRAIENLTAATSFDSDPPTGNSAP